MTDFSFGNFIAHGIEFPWPSQFSFKYSTPKMIWRLGCLLRECLTCKPARSSWRPRRSAWRWCGSPCRGRRGGAAPGRRGGCSWCCWRCDGSVPVKGYKKVPVKPVLFGTAPKWGYKLNRENIKRTKKADSVKKPVSGSTLKDAPQLQPRQKKHNRVTRNNLVFHIIPPTWSLLVG